MTVLKHTVDAYKSAVIAELASGSSIDPLTFESDLFESLTEFRAKGYRGKIRAAAAPP